jgi:hypothetical protein
MILKAIIEDQEYILNVPAAVMTGATGFFDQLDHDMDQGWQMSREWVETPNQIQRCQIVADKLLSALEKENHKVGMLMAGYILSRLPGVEAVEIDVQGEIQNNSFRVTEQPDGSPRRRPSESAPAPSAAAPANAETHFSGHVGAKRDGFAEPTSETRGQAAMSRLEAMTQAGNDVTKVFKVGKAWRFSVYDHRTERWADSPLIASEQEAERLRQAAVKERFEKLVSGS